MIRYAFREKEGINFKMQNILTMQTKQYAIKINNFEGPLDLLCHLIDKNKMDIYDIQISEIADQYLEYIHKAEEMNLEITSEFLIMASTLLYLKATTKKSSMDYRFQRAGMVESRQNESI